MNQSDTAIVLAALDVLLGMVGKSPIDRLNHIEDAMWILGEGSVDVQPFMDRLAKLQDSIEFQGFPHVTESWSIMNDMAKAVTP